MQANHILKDSIAKALGVELEKAGRSLEDARAKIAAKRRAVIVHAVKAVELSDGITQGQFDSRLSAAHADIRTHIAEQNGWKPGWNWDDDKGIKGASVEPKLGMAWNPRAKAPAMTPPGANDLAAVKAFVAQYDSVSDGVEAWLEADETDRYAMHNASKPRTARLTVTVPNKVTKDQVEALVKFIKENDISGAAFKRALPGIMEALRAAA